jgi:hypothetical protein
MVCSVPVKFLFYNPILQGTRTVNATGDGYSISLSWYKAAISPPYYKLYYNIYYSSFQESVFTEGVKFIAPSTIDQVLLEGIFKPGDIYFFAVRPTGFEPNTFLFDSLPDAGNGLKIYPESLLADTITATDTIIPLIDVTSFPPYGLIQIGYEAIKYSSVDLVNNLLILSSVADRGVYGSTPRIHTPDGYDGSLYHNPLVYMFKGFEDGNISIGLAENKFKEQYAYTNTDGYRDRQDILTSDKDVTIVENSNDGFPIFDYAGWRRTDPADMLAGKCIGSYYGGEYGCADGYDSDGRIRGLSFQDINNQRQEVLLNVTGEPVVLFKRMWKGKTSKQYDSSRENTIYRGFDNYGTEFVSGYEQYFNSRRSDGRIMVRFGPTKENYERQEPGIENVFVPNCWTLVTPALKDGDFIIRFNEDGSEEWRYEVLDVDRNRTVLLESGAQKFTVSRVRKTDPIYQVRAIRDTSMFPKELLTGVGSAGKLLPHLHRIVVNEGILTVSQINQMTSISNGHNHAIVNGVVQTVLGHTHSIILP